MNHRFRFTADKIAKRLDLIAPFVFRRSWPLPAFRLKELAGPEVSPPLDEDTDTWPEIAPGSYWGRCELDFCLRARTEVPADADAARLALHLPLGVMGDIFGHPEALVYVNGTPVGSADRHHHVVPLTGCAPGQTIDIALHGWTGMVSWPPDRASPAKLVMGHPALVEEDPDLAAFLAEARAMRDTVGQLDDDRPERHRLLNALDAAFLTLDTSAPLEATVRATVAAALEDLRAGKAGAGAPLDVDLIGIGHAHMDIAYLWQIAQCRRKNGRTYANALRLMAADPDFRFSHSQPQLYRYTEEDYPALFDQIKARVASGQWEPIGGMWVEPDLNIPGGEALVRQLTLGRGYFRDRFGEDAETPVLWLPDTFGFPASIPQLMRQAGLKWFATNKLNWNQTNRVPASTHWWEGLDGSRVLAHVLTTPREVQYLPFPTNYKSDLSAEELRGTWTHSTAKETVGTLPICYGFGDGGGGPKEDQLATARAYRDMPGMPRLRLGTVREAFEALEAVGDALTVWRGEHYLEGHRGVLTSQAWIKRANRKAEMALHEVEALAVMAGTRPDLTRAWELLCLNQFHDVLTGTSITEVFADARRDFAEVETIVGQALADASAALGGPEPMVANTAPQPTDRFALVPPDCGAIGQETAEGLLVWLRDLPPYSLTSATAAEALPAPEMDATAALDPQGGGAWLENGLVRVALDGAGRVVDLYDKAAGRAVLPSGARGNQFQIFEDRPLVWDAWDVDPFFEDRLEEDETPGEVTVLESGPLRAMIEIRKTLVGCPMVQRISIRTGSKRIDFDTEIDWSLRHRLVKVAFPVDVRADQARYEIQWGSVTRPTHANTPWDAARFELPAQSWADLSAPDYGAALLNDCKYAYDIRDAVMRLTLLKSSTIPDPEADQGRHVFTYAFLPHTGDWRNGVAAEAADLNYPLRVVPAGGGDGERSPLVASDAANVRVETIKWAEAGSGVVVRLFETTGGKGPVQLRFGLPVRRAARTDLHEREIATVAVADKTVTLDLGPFEIVTLRLDLD